MSAHGKIGYGNIRAIGSAKSLTMIRTHSRNCCLPMSTTALPGLLPCPPSLYIYASAQHNQICCIRHRSFITSLHQRLFTHILFGFCDLTLFSSAAKEKKVNWCCVLLVFFWVENLGWTFNWVLQFQALWIKGST